ncbi:alpha/beta hydrolase [bacterium]|nr:alpha/beta hydrolase [bacterium]
MNTIRQCYLNHLFFRKFTQPDPTGTLLFVHGLGESGLCFERIIEVIIKHPLLSAWNLLIPDLPGYGKSLKSKHPHSLQQLAKLILEIMQNLPKPVVLIGHSMGGVIGQLVSESDVNKPDAFINIEGNLTPNDCVFSSQAAVFSAEEFKSFGFDQLKITVYENSLNFPAQRGYYASMRFAESSQFLLNSKDLTAFAAPGNAANRFANLKIPKLYIAGQPRGICQESLVALEKSKAPSVLIDDSGHWPFIDQEINFIQILDIFLKRYH